MGTGGLIVEPSLCHTCLAVKRAKREELVPTIPSLVPEVTVLLRSKVKPSTQSLPACGLEASCELANFELYVGLAQVFTAQGYRITPGVRKSTGVLTKQEIPQCKEAGEWLAFEDFGSTRSITTLLPSRISIFLTFDADGAEENS